MTNKELILERFKLEDEIKELENRKQELIKLSKRRDEIGKLRNPLSRQIDDDYDWSFKQFRIGQFDEEKLKKLPDYETKWKNSYYIRHQVECESIMTISFDSEFLDKRLENTERIFQNRQRQSLDSKERHYNYFTFKNVCVLETLFPTQDGYRLVLSDPFKTVPTEVVKKEKLPKDIESMIGRMVLVGLKMNKWKKDAILDSIKILPYTLHSDL